MGAPVSDRAAVARATCAHCGLPVPQTLVQPGAEQQFCCAGCRQVYTLVREWGLDKYYDLVQRQQGTLAPARVTGRSFEDFDDDRAGAARGSISKVSIAPRVCGWLKGFQPCSTASTKCA
jgi:hypothetical protein